MARLFAVCGIGLGLAAGAGLSAWGEPVRDAAGAREAAEARLGRLPLYFERADNHGREYVAQAHGALLRIGPAGTKTVFASFPDDAEAPRFRRAGSIASDLDCLQTVSLDFLDSSLNARVQGQGLSGARINYLLGSTPEDWASAPAFDRVAVHGLYAGIDVVYYGNQEQLEYDFVVAPLAEPRSIRFRFSGADDLRLSPEGDLLIRVGRHELRHRAPVAYQQKQGVRMPVRAEYALSSDRTVSFKIGEYDRSSVLVIDPVLVYSSYLGGRGTDIAWDVALGPEGRVYIAGETLSQTLKTTTSSFQRKYGGGLSGGAGDGFVACLDSTGTNLVYLTYLGGRRNDGITAIAVDALGCAYVTGVTDSTNFPTRGAFSGQNNGQPKPSGILPLDAFVTKLNPTGSALEFSTYLGGKSHDQGLDIALGADNSVYVAGFTYSTNFPTLNAFQSTFSGTNGTDAFVTHLSPDGSALLYSTFIGGDDDDHGEGIAVDASGRAFVTGYTVSTNFPITPDAFQTFLAGGTNGGSDVFFTIVGADGSYLEHSTYFGGLGNDVGFRVALDPSGNAYVTGAENGLGFPITPTGFQPGGVYRSDDGGALWAQSSVGLSHNEIGSLAFDPSNPARVYVGTWRGIARSNDRGATWNYPAKTIGTPAYSIAIDPGVPSTLYIAGAGVAKSLDGGDTWESASTGLVAGVSVILVNSAATQVLFAGAADGVYVSTNAAASWQRSSIGLPRANVADVVQDPVNPAVLYAANPYGVYRSTDLAQSWEAASAGLSNAAVARLAIDPINPSTLYARTYKRISSSRVATGLFKTTDSGSNWVSIGGPLHTNLLTDVAVDPSAPANVYVGSTNGVFKSTDGGVTWSTTTNGMGTVSVSVIAPDPSGNQGVLVGTRPTGASSPTSGEHAFLARFGSDPFSIILGGVGGEKGWDVATDAAGNAYVVGSTRSTNFPVVANFGALSSTNRGRNDVFITAVRPDASALVYSVYLGGRGDDFAYGVAADAAGNLAVVGRTLSTSFPVTTNALYRKPIGASDAFLSRISSAASPGAPPAPAPQK